MNTLLFLLCLLCTHLPASRTHDATAEHGLAPQEAPSQYQYLRLKVHPQAGHESVSYAELEHIAHYIYQLGGDNEYLQIYGGHDEMEVFLPRPCMVRPGLAGCYVDQSKQIIARIRQFEHPSYTPANHLELLPVHPDSWQILNQLWHQHLETGEALTLPAELSDYQLVQQKQAKEGAPYDQNYLIVARPEFMDKQGLLVNSFDVFSAQQDELIPGTFHFILSHKGAEKLSKITKEMKYGQDRIAIIIGGQLLSSPIVQSTISREFQCSGHNGEELDLLSKSLEGCIAVPNKVEIVEEELVEADEIDWGEDEESDPSTN